MHRSASTLVLATALFTGVGTTTALAAAGPAPQPLGVTSPGGALQNLPSSSLLAPHTSGGTVTRQQAAGGGELVGQFAVTSGQCSGSGNPTGSYFAMVDPSGNPVSNSNSPCSNKNSTPLAAGSSGLVTETFQPFASSPGASSTIVKPATFFGSPFAAATQNPDKQTGQSTVAPQVFNQGGTLSGQMKAFQVFYNGAYYNQGAPKPDGSRPGSTSAGVTGTYDSATGAYTLDWKSTISGGAFNNFTGVWHLQGAFTASAGGSSSGSSPSSGSSSTSSGSGTTSTTGTASPAAGGGTLALTGSTLDLQLPAAMTLLGLVGFLWNRRTLRRRSV